MENATESILIVASAIAGALIPLIRSLVELVTKVVEYRKVSKKGQDSTALRRDVGQETGRLIAWLVIIVGTLLVPTGALILGTIAIVSPYLARIETDFSAFALLLSATIGAINALYPLAWGIYIYPIFRDFFQRQDQVVQRTLTDPNGRTDEL